MSNSDVSPSPPFKNPCVIHDPITVYGGAEEYVTKIASGLDIPLYTSTHEIDIGNGADVRTFETSSKHLLRYVPFLGEYSRFLQYENFEVPKRHDAVITSGIFARSVIHRPFQRRFHLLHTPTRWLFDRGPGMYANSISLVQWAQRLNQSFRRVHEISLVPRIDDFITNSELIDRRLRTYYNRNSTATIYPPVDINDYYNESRGGFLFYVGRLEDSKGIDQMIEAARDEDWTLKLAGTGSREEEFRSMAGENVEFLGFVTEEEKRSLLARCDALLFNSEHEDFGIVPVEALASGKPVVGVNEGFTKYQIENGVNGILFQRGVENLRAAILEMYDRDWDVDEIQTTAEQYSTASCLNRWRHLLETETNRKGSEQSNHGSHTE